MSSCAIASRSPLVWSWHLVSCEYKHCFLPNRAARDGLLRNKHSASTATIVRIGYLPYYSIAEDYLYNVSQIAIWSIIESGIGIIAGSMATLRPLLQYIPFLSSTFNSSSSKSKKTKQRGQSYKLDSLRASHAGVLQTKCHAGRDEFGFDSESASQKAILHRSTEKAILHSTEIRITKDIVQASTEDGEDA